MEKEDLELIRRSIRNIPDFPKPGIQFKDISTLLLDREAMSASIDCLREGILEQGIDCNKIAAIFKGIICQGCNRRRHIYACKACFVIVRIKVYC